MNVSITACVELCFPCAVSFMDDAPSTEEHRGQAEISACVRMKFSIGGTQATPPEGDAESCPGKADEVDGSIVVEVGAIDGGLSLLCPGWLKNLVFRICWVLTRWNVAKIAVKRRQEECMMKGLVVHEKTHAKEIETMLRTNIEDKD